MSIWDNEFDKKVDCNDFIVFSSGENIIYFPNGIHKEETTELVRKLAEKPHSDFKKLIEKLRNLESIEVITKGKETMISTNSESDFKEELKNMIENY